MMTSTAPFRNPPPGLPDDPPYMILKGRDGWPIAAPYTDLVVSPLDHHGSIRNRSDTTGKGISLASGN